MYGVHTVCASMPVCMHIPYAPHVIVCMQVCPYNSSACSAINMLFVSFLPHGRRETQISECSVVGCISKTMCYACVCFKFNTIQLWFLVLNNENLQKQWLSLSKASKQLAKSRKRECVQKQQERACLRRKCTDGYMKERHWDTKRRRASG